MLLYCITLSSSRENQRSAQEVAICTSRTQRVVGDNSHTAYHQRLNLIQRYCWLKRPGPTLRVRLRETGSLDVLCTEVACE